MRIIMFGLLGVMACTTAPAPSSIPAAPLIDLGEIETDVRGQCFARAADRTQVRVVDDMIEVAPAVRDANGTITTPGVFRRITKPETIVTGLGPRFETLCPQRYTPSFVASLQRALVVRQAYVGPISGDFDTATQNAVRQVQRRDGIDSALLSVTLARELGVLSVPRDPS